MTNYPVALDTLNNPISTDSLVGHTAQHTNANDAIEALQSRVGIINSIDQDSIEYRLTSVENVNIIPISTSQAIGGNRLVVLDSAGLGIYADNTDISHAHKVFGMSLGSASAGQVLNIQRTGKISEPTWNWQPNLPIFLGTNGLPTQVPPTFEQSAFSLIIGFPITNTEIFLNIGNLINLGN